MGPVAAKHVFYLQSRGIPRQVAQRIVVQGFLGEILDPIPVRHVRDAVEHELATRLG